jgi:hypothetical protein
VTLVIRHWTSLTANSVFYFGHQRRVSLTNIADGLVTAVVVFGFVKLLGLPGALLGSMAGAVLVSLPLNIGIIARDAGVSMLRLIAAMLGGWSWRFVLVAGTAGWIAARWSPKTLLECAGVVITAAAVYCAIMLPNVLRMPLGNYTRPLLESFRHKYTALRGTVASVWS